MPKINLDNSDIGTLAPLGAQTEYCDSGFRGVGSFGVRVNAGGRRSFFLVYRLNGVRRRMNLGFFPVMSLQAARERAELVLREVALGRDPARERKAYEVILSFKELCEMFLRDHVKRELSATAAKEYERIVQRELIPPWGAVSPSSITEREVGLLISAISERRGKAVLAERVRAVLSKLYSFALERRIVASNPVKGIIDRGIARGRREAPPVRVLSYSEITHLLRLLADESSVVSAVVQLVIYTGQLPQSVLAMRWADISNERWRVQDDHEIIFSPAALRVIQLIERTTLGEEYVFASPRGGHIRSIRREISALSKRLKLMEHWNLRDLRRTFQYRIREIGVRPDVIERIQNRRSSFGRAPRNVSYNYAPDIREALLKWGERIAPPPPKKSSGKIIQLFPRRDDSGHPKD